MAANNNNNRGIEFSDRGRNFGLALYPRDALTGAEIWRGVDVGAATDTAADNRNAHEGTGADSAGGARPSLPRRIDLGVCTVSRLKVEKFLTFVLSTCLVFLVIKGIEQTRLIKRGIVPDLMAGFVMIFFLHDLFRLPGHENEGETPTG